MHLSFWSLNWAFKLPVRLGAEEEAQWQVLGQGTEEARGTKSCYIHRQETQGNSWGRLKASSDIPNLLQPAAAKKTKRSEFIPQPLSWLPDPETVDSAVCERHCRPAALSPPTATSVCFLLPPPALLPSHPPPSLLGPHLAPSLLPHPPFSSIPPSSPRSLLVALAGLLLTEEPFDLRHPRCLALSRDKEGSCEGPRPPEGRCPVEGGGSWERSIAGWGHRSLRKGFWGRACSAVGDAGLWGTQQEAARLTHPLLPALDTAEDAEPGEEQKA